MRYKLKIGTDIYNRLDSGRIVKHGSKFLMVSDFQYDSGFCYYYKKNLKTNGRCTVVIDDLANCKIMEVIRPVSFIINETEMRYNPRIFQSSTNNRALITGIYSKSIKESFLCSKYFTLSKDSVLHIAHYNLENPNASISKTILQSANLKMKSDSFSFKMYRMKP